MSRFEVPSAKRVWVATALLTITTFGCRGDSPSGSAQGDEPMIDPIPASEIPPAPVLSPTEALADFQIEPGFRIELVAAEPDVVAPVAMTFDGNGAAWVVEMRGYMQDTEGGGEDKPNGRVRVLRDLDNNGVFETATTFLDGLVMPRAIAMVDGGILLAEPPNLWYVENNDYEAGKRTLVDAEYAVGGNPEHQPNGLLQAIDNWIYSAKSDIRYRLVDGVWVKDSTEFRGQWGISQDDYGRLFYNHNSATLLGDNVPPNTFPSNPNHNATHTNIGAPKAPNRVYTRRINPGVNRAYRKETLGDDGRLHNVTGTCGPVVYRGTNFPATHYGNAFVMEPTGNVVMRVVLSDSSGVVSGAAPYEGREFLSSTDERFRPVNAYTGPDGALYVVDMYRGVIQHVTYLTEYLRRQIEQRGLASPLDLGRIYRIRSEDAPLDAQPNMLAASTSELVAYLTNQNGWWRDTAQRLIVQQQDPAATAELRMLVSGADVADVTRIHALWSLEGLGELRLADLRSAGSATSNSKVHATLLRLASVLAASGTDVERDQLLDFVESFQTTDREARLQRVLALHAFRPFATDRVDDAFIDAAAAHAGDSEVVDAVLGGLRGTEDAFQLHAEGRREEVPALYAAVEQARFAAQLGPVQEALALADEHQDAFSRGLGLYRTHCAACHGRDGKGLPAQAPPLVHSQWVLQDAETAARITLDGLTGPISVNGEVVVAPNVLDVMPGFRTNRAVSDADLADVLTYVRNGWENRASAVSTEQVARVREETRSRGANPYTQDELIAARASGWDSLMPDSSFTGWEKLGGEATYAVVGEEVIGTTVPRSPNTFLATRRHFDNFILEFDVLVDSLINSGVQIRSNSLPDYQNGRVHGYQIEIDPSDRAWSAGIYDESRRGWLFDLRGNPAARKAFNRRGWNHYRVEARGPHIRTWINGVLAADLIDDMTPSGFIALQVHAVGSSDLVGRTIRWRNLRIRDLEAAREMAVAAESPRAGS